MTSNHASLAVFHITVRRMVVETLNAMIIVFVITTIFRRDKDKIRHVSPHMVADVISCCLG